MNRYIVTKKLDFSLIEKGFFVVGKVLSDVTYHTSA